jgi:hypothetical protein
MMNIKRSAEDAAACEDPDDYVRMERLSNEALPVQAMVLLHPKECPCVLPVQFRRSAGAFAWARSGEG